MQITKNHIFNVVLWVIIILFMAVKSIEHTIFTHEQGVNLAIQEYRIQAQARMNLIKSIKSANGFRDSNLSYVFHQLKLIRYENDPYQYIYLNDQLTSFIDQKIDFLNMSDEEKAELKELHHYIEQESLIYLAHAQSFNRLIQRFPYVLFSKNYPLINIEHVASANGVIVER